MSYVVFVGKRKKKARKFHSRSQSLLNKNIIGQSCFCELQGPGKTKTTTKNANPGFMCERGVNACSPPRGRKKNQKRAQGWKRQDVFFSPVDSPLAVGRGAQSRGPVLQIEKARSFVQTHTRGGTVGTGRREAQHWGFLINAPKLPGGMNLW